MQPLLKRIKHLSSQLEAAFVRLAVEDKQKTIDELEGELATSEIWNNPQVAQEKSKQLANLTSMVEPWVTLRAQVSDIAELIEMNDDSLLAEFD
jgi:protein subunit release factor A